MNKLFTKLAAGFIGLTMVASVGAVIGSKALEKNAVEANAATKSDWSKISGSVTAGVEYLIVKISDDKCMAPKNSTPSGETTTSQGNYSQIDFTSSSAPANGFVFADAGNGNFYIKDGVTYVYCGDTNNGVGSIKTIGSNDCIWTITETTTGSYTIISTSKSRQISAYSTTNWRSYGQNSGSKTEVHIYQKAGEIETYTASFNGNGAKSGEMDDVTGLSGSYTLPDSDFVPQTGMGFIGWKAENSGELLRAGSTYNITSDVTFYAQWDAVYSLSYDNNGGEGTIGSKKYAAGDVVTLNDGTNFTKANCSLDGWSTSADGAKEYDLSGSFTMPAENTTLYAHWVQGYTWDQISSSNAYGFPTTQITTEDEYFDEVHTVTFNATNVKVNSGYFMIYSNGGMYNTSAIPGAITSLKVTFTAGVSTSSKVHIGLGNASGSKLTIKQNEATCSQSGTLLVTANATEKLSYFSILETSGSKNAQIAKIELHYDTISPIESHFELEDVMSDNTLYYDDCGTLKINYVNPSEATQYPNIMASVVELDALVILDGEGDTYTYVTDTPTGESATFTLSVYAYSSDYSSHINEDIVVSIIKPAALVDAIEYAESYFNDVCEAGNMSAQDWSDASEAYSVLLDADAQEYLTSADYTYESIEGRIVPTAKVGTHSLIAKAMYQYDYCMKKYEYNNFMTRTPVYSLGISVNALFAINNGNNPVALIVIVSVIGLTAVGAFYYIRRRRQHN